MFLETPMQILFYPPVISHRMIYVLAKIQLFQSLVIFFIRELLSDLGRFPSHVLQLMESFTISFLSNFYSCMCLISPFPHNYFPFLSCVFTVLKFWLLFFIAMLFLKNVSEVKTCWVPQRHLQMFLRESKALDLS